MTQITQISETICLNCQEKIEHEIPTDSVFIVCPNCGFFTHFCFDPIEGTPIKLISDSSTLQDEKVSLIPIYQEDIEKLSKNDQKQIISLLEEILQRKNVASRSNRVKMRANIFKTQQKKLKEQLERMEILSNAYAQLLEISKTKYYSTETEH